MSLLFLVKNLDHGLVCFPLISQILEVSRSLSRVAFDHEKLDSIDLSSMIMPLSDDLAVFKAPEDHYSITGDRSEVAVALAHLDVDNHIFVTMQGSLKN